MREGTRRFGWVSVYAVAMACLEAVVVVYLRAMLQVNQDQVSLGPYLALEVWREVATLAMLVAVGCLAGQQNRVERWCYAFFAFGLWDIAYYGWLRVFLGWPATLLDWDILFLIPFRWWGPVVAPVLIALLICASSVLAVARLGRGQRLAITPLRLATIIAGALLALYVFMADSLHSWLSGQGDWATLRPAPFRWLPFWIALACMALPSLAIVGRRPSRPLHLLNAVGAISGQAPDISAEWTEEG